MCDVPFTNGWNFLFTYTTSHQMNDGNISVYVDRVEMNSSAHELDAWIHRKLSNPQIMFYLDINSVEKKYIGFHYRSGLD